MSNKTLFEAFPVRDQTKLIEATWGMDYKSHSRGLFPCCLVACFIRILFHEFCLYYSCFVDFWSKVIVGEC